jgi:glucose-6-phosphate 1-dehydrogenase
MSARPSDAIVFFGATGDLAYEQIFPAPLGLVHDEGSNVPIIGVAKAGWRLDQLKARAVDSLRHHGDVDATTVLHLRYVDGDRSDEATVSQLRSELGQAQCPPHYLAVPSSLFAAVAQALAQSGRADGARLVIEKPLGHNRATARTLDRLLSQHFPEENIFRIDHYLGKEPVQNITYTRFANSMFEPLWNRDHVSSIQITMAEDFGVQDRGNSYDETGAVRDVVQNNILHEPNLRPSDQWLLGDALRGVGELYKRDDIVDAQWPIVEPILDNATPVYPYRPGTWGPHEAHALIAADGTWRNPNIAAETFT